MGFRRAVIAACLLIGCKSEQSPRPEVEVASSLDTETMQSDDTSRPPKTASRPQARVPMGLKGLSFGMSTAEAIKALPELSAGLMSGTPTLRAEEIEFSTEEIENLESEKEIARQKREIQVLGKPSIGARIGATTTIGKEPAYCRFEFAVAMNSEQYGLSRIECHLGSVASKYSSVGVQMGSYGTRSEHCAALKRLSEALGEKYGSPSSTGSDEDVYTALIGGGVGGESCPETLTWKNSDAVLELRSTTSLAMSLGDDLAIINYSTKHQEAIDAAREADRQHREVEHAQREAKEAEERRRNLERTGNVQRSLSDDL